MTTLFEDRSSYDAAVDSIGIATITVECNPGQLEHVMNYLASVAAQAGVYQVSTDSAVIAPAPPIEIEIPSKGEAHGEPEIQPEHLEPETASDEQGPDAAPGGAEAGSDAGADSEVGRATGQVGAEPLGGSDEGKGVSEVGRAVEPSVADSGARESTAES